MDEQRASILDAAEKLFLQRGLENTHMVDIAAQAGITKVTLYRYFANRDVIALEIHIRMMEKINASLDPLDFDLSPAGIKRLAQSMIRNFPSLRDAYCYMGMFDKIYLDNPSGAALSQWTKGQLVAIGWEGVPSFAAVRQLPHGSQFVLAVNTVVWFLEKLALRGELTWSDPSIPLEEHLKSFEEMIIGYLDHMIT